MAKIAGKRGLNMIEQEKICWLCGKPTDGQDFDNCCDSCLPEVIKAENEAMAFTLKNEWEGD